MSIITFQNQRHKQVVLTVKPWPSGSLTNTVCLRYVLLQVKLTFYENIKYKTGVINDPLGQTHSPASSEHCFRFKLVLF